MNSVLQCLTHTPPLAEAMLGNKPMGDSGGLDPLRITQDLIRKALTHRGLDMQPMEHAKTLRRISKR